MSQAQNNTRLSILSVCIGVAFAAASAGVPRRARSAGTSRRRHRLDGRRQRCRDVGGRQDLRAEGGDRRHGRGRARQARPAEGLERPGQAVRLADGRGPLQGQRRAQADRQRARACTLPTDLDAKHKSVAREARQALGPAVRPRLHGRHGRRTTRQDVADFSKEANSGKDADLKAFAGKTLPTLEDHLKMAQSTDAPSRAARRCRRRWPPRLPSPEPLTGSLHAPARRAGTVQRATSDAALKKPPACPAERRHALAALSALFVAACGGGGDRAGAGTGAARRLRRAGAGARPRAFAAFLAFALARSGERPLRQLREPHRSASTPRSTARSPFPPTTPGTSTSARRRSIPNSDALIAGIGLATGLHPDFGAGLLGGASSASRTSWSPASQAQRRHRLHAYGDESDAGPVSGAGRRADRGRLGGNEHRRSPCPRDRPRHQPPLRAVRRHPQADGSWNAASGAVFHLDSNAVRPTAQAGWTSADAAGLPIFPGLARYDEAAVGPGGSATRCASRCNASRRAYVPPASHFASSTRARACRRWACACA